MTIKAGVIGYPIAHSLSPRIHQYWLKLHGIDGSYEAIEVHPDDLADFLKSLPEKGFAGVNVTLPHKEKAMQLVHRVDTVERIIGAVNTIYVGPDGKLDANNTDYYGFYKNLRQYAPDFDFTAGRAVVLGAGGAAKAVCAALIALCDVPEITLINRTRERAEEVQARLKEFFSPVKDTLTINVVDWDKRNDALHDAHMLINTTALGMKGKDKLEIDLSLLPKDALVTDIVYNPLETDLLKQAKARGSITVDGLGMLLHQAVLGFHKWFGVEPEVTPELRAHVLEALQ